MKIIQIVLPGASEYERKSQRTDFASFSRDYEIVIQSSIEKPPAAGLAHVYGALELPSPLFHNFPLPYITNSLIRRPRFFGRSYREPWRRIWPLEREGTVLVPESVEECYFASPALSGRPPSGARLAGVFTGMRPGVVNAVEQALVRLLRFRDDVSFLAMDHPPTPKDLAGVDLWVDPTVQATDFDGFVAEAVVSGVPVVASRTAINEQRLEGGRTGMLVPVGDPNELTHAILNVLFKPEVAQLRIDAARQTASKFHPRQRQKVLSQLYGTIND